MKRIILITFLLAFGITESMYGQINLNFSSGMNYSNCKFEEFEGVSPQGRFGYFIGIAPSYQISEKIQFQVDFQYSLKGYDTANESNFIASDFRYAYFDIIPEIEYYFIENLALGFGVNYGIKINEQFKIGNEDWSNSGDYETINPIDYGLTGKLKFNYKNLFGFVRYNIGLNDIADVTFTDRNGQSIEDAKQLNRNIQVGIGYKLNFKKD